MEFEIWWFLAFGVVIVAIRALQRVVLAFVERRPTRSQALPGTLDERLARIEQAVESTALEVERIGEGQRFLTRALTDRGHSGAALPGAAERVITPHQGARRLIARKADKRRPMEAT